MSQVAMQFGPQYEGREAWERQLEVLRAAVSHLVAKDVADQLDVNRSTLSDALKSVTDRRWAAEWTHIVKAMLAARRADEVAIGLLRKICEADMSVTPLVVDEAIDMTNEEEAAVTRFLDKLRRRKTRAR